MSYSVFPRFCSICGTGMIEGYVDEDNAEYYCSYRCLKSELDLCFGIGIWREASKTEKEAIDRGDYGSDHGYIFYTNLAGVEQLLNIYHTDWLDEINLRPGDEFAVMCSHWNYHYRFIGVEPHVCSFGDIHLYNLDTCSDTYVEPAWFHNHTVLIYKRS